MKKIIALFTLTISLYALADIDVETLKSNVPTAGEVVASRSCFQELERFGCRHPREDLEQFKSCMNNILSSLTPACQKMMAELYGKRN